MCENLNQNPFLGLFSTPEEAALIVVNDSSTSIADEPGPDVENNIVNNLNEANQSPTAADGSNQRKREDKIIEDVFGLLLSNKPPNSTRQLVAVESDSIENAVFERITLPNIEEKLVPSKTVIEDICDPHCIQPNAIPYLFECYSRLRKYQNDEKLRDFIDHLKLLTLRSFGTALEPDIFEDQKVHDHYVKLFRDEETMSEAVPFTEELVAAIIKDYPEDADEVLELAFQPVLKIIYVDAAKSDLLGLSQWWYDILRLFASIEPLARIFISYSTPQSKQGDAYVSTVLGALLSISCLPKKFSHQFPFFAHPLNQPMVEEGQIWRTLKIHTESLYKIFHVLLKCSPEIKHLTLQWLGKCLQSNSSRGNLWPNQLDMGHGVMSDGFMLNLINVLLRLCQPFCTNCTSDMNIPHIDPTYCAAEPVDDDDSRQRGLHMREMSKMTCLIPTPEGDSRPVAQSFGFVTECFYLSHRAIDLGYRIVIEKLSMCTQYLERMQRLADENSGSLQLIKERREAQMTMYLSYRASLLDPELLNLLCKFHATTAFWLLQVHMNNDDVDNYNKPKYYPEAPKGITFPLPEPVAPTLRCIPEFIVENTVGFICLLRRLNPNTFEEQGPTFLHSILSELIALMESPQRLFNPHLRAQLAEGLEALLPHNEDLNNRNQATLGTFHREQLFITHPFRDFIVPHLLQVFVSIEMTGQSVQFEQKFNYRLPMYIVMKYLWKIEEHKINFQRLAQDAEDNMEAVQPPLFLRFINLLMNDAVFLLDEALTNMTQLKQMVQAKENGEWDRLPADERAEQMRQLRHIGMIARFDNILGRETISALKMLTSEIKSIFCHSTMVDRIASMLNYLLLQLVGPNQRNLKVKDQKEYEFNPAQLVLSICEIYINLGQNENFILAVSQDGRSYRPNLFQLADNVLVRIGGISILGDLENLAKEVAKAASIKEEEDELLLDAPDEFLDPIMSTLMVDPVILPSSKITVGRQTIARHLLSDQTDPFNRSPLTMDMIKSDVDLRNKIEQWIALKKQSCPNKQ